MKHIVSRMSSYFPNRWPLSYLNLTKNMKTYIRRQQHKKIFKHQDIKQKEPPQKYRLGTISNTKFHTKLLYTIVSYMSSLRVSNKAGSLYFSFIPDKKKVNAIMMGFPPLSFLFIAQIQNIVLCFFLSLIHP